jgi:hypothetical protein
VRSGAEGKPRSRQLPRAHPSRQMFEAGMFLQQDMTMVPTSSEYAGVGNQKDFDPNSLHLTQFQTRLVCGGNHGAGTHWCPSGGGSPVAAPRPPAP